MEIGLVFALLSAVCFSGSTVFVRKGAFQAGESFTAVVISVFVGILFFPFLMLFTADWDKLWSLSGQSVILLGIAGITHFVLGRLFGYTCFRLIGANKGSAILRTQVFYAVILGVLFLNEPITIFLILGVLCLTVGVTFVSMEKGGETTKLHARGILAGLGGAFFWGVSPILIRPAVVEIGSPYAATFISYFAASIVMAGLLLGKGQRQQLRELRRESFLLLVASGIFTAVAQLLRYLALIYSPASVVTPLITTAGLFTFFLSFLINRNIEVFTWKVLTGIVVTIAGAFLFFM